MRAALLLPAAALIGFVTVGAVENVSLPAIDHRECEVASIGGAEVARHRVRVRNLHRLGLVAWAIEWVEREGRAGLKATDHLLSPTRQVGPGATGESSWDGSSCAAEIRVAAAVYADGVTAGEEPALRRLLDDRVQRGQDLQAIVCGLKNSRMAPAGVRSRKEFEELVVAIEDPRAARGGAAALEVLQHSSAAGQLFQDADLDQALSKDVLIAALEEGVAAIAEAAGELDARVTAGAACDSR